MKQNFQFSLNCVNVNVDLMRVDVIQGKNGIMINVVVVVKNQMIGVLVKMNICGILECVIVDVIRRAKLINISILKSVHAEHC